MIKRILAALVLVVIAGCGNTVKTTLSERYGAARPLKVAVLPVVWEEQAADEANEVSYLFRTMTSQKLLSKNYRVIALEEIDEAFLKQGKAAFFARKPEEIAKSLGADAVLYTKVTQWDKSAFITYISLDIEALYEMYSASGERLWDAEYVTEEADITLDTSSAEYAVLKAYEPRVQRFVDIVFTTLPDSEATGQTRKFFQWLP